MVALTIEELTDILRSCAGADESVNLDGDILDATFEDLGYDSLALMETIAEIGRRRDVRLGDDLARAETPRELIGLANGALVGAPA